MEIFISWSGERSKIVAELLKEWLPRVIQKLKPWISASDIDKGARWLKEISGKLESVNYGIICLTPENLDEKWILFEAGALSKSIDVSSVCPILFELDPSSVKGPLSQFQATVLTKEDMKSLLVTLNNILTEDKLSDQQLEESFELWWPKLKEKIDDISPPEKKVDTERSEKDILVEILRIVRGFEREYAKNLSIKETTEKVLATLSPMEEKVLRMRFGIGKIEDVNSYKNLLKATLGISEDEINNLEKQALRKLRDLDRPKK